MTIPLLVLPAGTTPTYREQVFDSHGSDEPDGWPPWHNEEPEFEEYTFKRCEFGKRLANVGFRDCRFEKCTFHSYVRSVEFMRCEFVDCEFDYSAIISTKLKFCRFEGCTFTGAAILRCDLYRAEFRRGNVFQRAKVGLVSLSRADVRGAGELRHVSFPPFHDGDELAPGVEEPQHPPSSSEEVRRLCAAVELPLIQEEPAEYEELLLHTTLTRPVDETLARRVIETSDAYRMLSGVWMSVAAYDDGSWAYRQSRHYTRASLAPGMRRSAAAGRKVAIVRREDGLRRAGAWLGLALAGPLCGFGTRLRGIVAAVCGLVAGFAVLLRAFDAVRVSEQQTIHHGGWFDALRYSVGQLVTTPPANAALSSRGWGLAASLETLIGITLLGLFGFVLANRLRFS
jgi:Pentapeptide repeats (9 copies)